jgi:hypothetical protein
MTRSTVCVMTRRPCTFRQTDLTRALRAAQAAGVPVRIEIEDGKITVVMDSSSTGESEKNLNEWDAEYGPDQTKTR